LELIFYKMNHATPQMRSFARCIITNEAEMISKDVPSAALIVRNLHPHLRLLMGNTGFCALLSRALVLTKKEFPWLRDVEVGADGLLENFDQASTKISPSVVTEGSVALIAHLLGLLVSFIGGNLTLQLIQNIWPDLSHEIKLSEENDLGTGHR